MSGNNLAKHLITNCLKDIKVELDEEFDENFSRKAFFSSAWKRRKYDNGKGSLLVGKGNLRRSVRSRIDADQLTYFNSEVYAAIHNEGGEITITRRMKRFFWAKYYEACGGIIYSIKRKKANNTKKNRQLSDEEEFYKSMALKKVGDKIIIPQRQFIGNSPETDKIIREIVEDKVQEFVSKFSDSLK